MQKINTLLIVLLAAAVAYLLYTRPATESAEEQQGAMITEEVMPDETAPNEGRSAYVNIDSLNNGYVFLEDMLEKLEAEQSRAQGRIRNKMQKAQERAMQLQQAVQTMTESEYLAAEKELQGLEVEMQQYQERLSTDLLRMEQGMEDDLATRLSDYLEEYNQDKGYDYIFGYQRGGQVLYGKDAYDITQEVLTALNERYLEEKAAETSEAAE